MEVLIMIDALKRASRRASPPRSRIAMRAMRARTDVTALGARGHQAPR